MKKAFTLAEVLITLAIIGVVAAMTIPSVIVNATQQEYRTGLRKAVASVNSAIQASIALDGEGTSSNGDVFNLLQRHMNVMSSTTRLKFNTGHNNYAFYTTDGMRWEVPYSDYVYLHESSQRTNNNYFSGCGTYGLGDRAEGDSNPPCLVVVDVNGDKRPNPANINSSSNSYTRPSASSGTINDLFLIMVSKDKAVPYGVVGQKAMYQSDK